ncbi:hypothetical protein [Flammeovirga kamogawensis]|uniref:Uncharacterized protein n=1 Tax=Flammeovirga kamogawensis TaxID=373891 RepID=A0ABX8H5R4_9BACT|nr:hypothetical protein [Flammeovirga kamogawensis]MBB6463842.1 hypothetical protein [Flammeovirga kamogawensis]QWG10767.1 hypothetical protein KM029_26775 [Flammeovirga kamogawensis]TRX63247.1 hypothetical protein EO216_26700 [Flammeovirga kamogawensis]
MDSYNGFNLYNGYAGTQDQNGQIIKDTPFLNWLVTLHLSNTEVIATKCIKIVDRYQEQKAKRSLQYFVTDRLKGVNTHLVREEKEAFQLLKEDLKQNNLTIHQVNWSEVYDSFKE